MEDTNEKLHVLTILIKPQKSLFNPTQGEETLYNSERIVAILRLIHIYFLHKAGSQERVVLSEFTIVSKVWLRRLTATLCTF